jgi:hypothetical protein
MFAVGSMLAVAPPAEAQEIAASDCGSTTYRWLFWPDGHDALKTVGHPASPNPHLDVYSGKGKKFAEAQNVAYADGTTTSTAGTCTPVELTQASGSAVLKSTIQPAQLVCKFSSKPTFLAVPESTVELPSLSALVNGKLVVNAMLGTPGNGSTLDYDGKACKVSKPPK